MKHLLALCLGVIVATLGVAFEAVFITALGVVVFIAGAVGPRDDSFLRKGDEDQ